MLEYKLKVLETKEERHLVSINSQYAFMPSPASLDDLEKKEKYQKENYVVGILEEGKEIASATAISLPMTQNVRGKVMKMAGIAGVASNPESRRRGYIKQLLLNIFIHAKDNNQVISTLYPFLESFYGHFGYVTFPQDRIATFSPQGISSLINRDMSGYGSVERMDIQTGFENYLKYLKTDAQPNTHGMCLKADSLFLIRKDENKSWLALAKDSKSKIIGSMTYTITGFAKEIKVSYLLYSTPQAKYLLLQFLAKHIDQVDKIILSLKPSEYPEYWLNDLKLQIKNRKWVPSAMGRVIDVEGLEDLQVGNGSFMAKIEDEHCIWNNKAFHFSSENNKLLVYESKSYDCVLTIQGLSALIYGVHDPLDFEHKGWLKNHSSHTMKDIKSLFAPKLPYMFETF